MQQAEKKQIKLPLEIPADRIGLPTGGAVVTKCTFFHAGEAEPEEIAQMYDFRFPADVCRYEGVIRPLDPEAPEIRFTVGVPENWNGKVIQRGGAGINGYIPPCSMPLHGQDRENMSALQQGYIVFESDSGHQIVNHDITDCRWMQNRECFENFAYQSLKKTKDAVIYFVEQLFGRTPERVYFYGGSNGGRECMKAVQNYPLDYDGAVCFFPVLYWVLKVLMDSRNAHALEQIGVNGMMDEEQCGKVAETAVKLCAGTDNNLTNVIQDWKGADAKREQVAEAVEKTVTKEQFEMLQTLAEPMSLSFPLAFGEVTLPGYEVYAGTDMTSHFSSLAQCQIAGGRSLSDAVLANALAQDADYDTHRFWAEDWEDRILYLSEWLDAYGTDLDAYGRAGGKLILVQGTVDPQVTVGGTVQYYEKLKERYGTEKLEEFVRFYVAPGYGHGTDGTFLITADFVSILDDWVEKGEGPEDIVVKDISQKTAGRTQVLRKYRAE